MKGRMLRASAVIVFFLLTGCGSGGSGSSGNSNSTSPLQAPRKLVDIPRKPVSQIHLVDTSMPGYKLFQSTCASCHGSSGEGGFGPPIYAIGKYWSEEQLTAFVEQGRGSMPARGGLSSNADVQKVVAWLAKQKG